jgi:hypothetical protein
MRAARNLLIVLGLAAVVAFVPGGGLSGALVVSILSVLFLASLAWFGALMYREHRVAILSLDTPIRAILYGSLAVAVLTVVATSRLWNGGGVGILAWFLLVGAASAGVVTVYRASQRY